MLEAVLAIHVAIFAILFRDRPFSRHELPRAVAEHDLIVGKVERHQYILTEESVRPERSRRALAPSHHLRPTTTHGTHEIGAPAHVPRPPRNSLVIMTN